MNYCTKRKLRRAIKYHYLMKEIILYEREHSTPYQKYLDMTDELCHKAYCELRCAQRLEKILNKYQTI